HHARPAGSDQLATKFLQITAVIVGDADLVARRAAEPRPARMQYDRLTVADQRGVLLLDSAIGRPGPALRPIGGKLHAPARHVRGDALRLLLRCPDQISKPRARYALRDRGLRGLRRRRRGPLVRRPAG